MVRDDATVKKKSPPQIHLNRFIWDFESFKSSQTKSLFAGN